MDSSTENLLVSKSAVNFNDWMYSEIVPFLSGDILEIGSGLGTFSDKIVRDFFNNKIILSDINSGYLSSLKHKFKNFNNVNSIEFDWGTGRYDPSIKADSIFALNVLEHIEDDMLALENAYKILNDGGKLIILVPCHKFLFNSLDVTAAHFRRYSKKEINEKVGRTNFKVVEMKYFNFFSIFGWYINGNIFKKPLLNKGSVKLFDFLVPVFKIIEKNILRKKAGISLIVVLQK